MTTSASALSGAAPPAESSFAVVDAVGAAFENGVESSLMRQVHITSGGQ